MKAVNLFTTTFNWDEIEKFELVHGSEELAHALDETFSFNKIEQLMKHYRGWMNNRGLITPEYKESKIFGDIQDCKTSTIVNT